MEVYEKLGCSCTKFKLKKALHFVFVLHLGTCLVSSNPIFVNPCNIQTRLGQASGNYSGKLYFSRGPNLLQQPTDCPMTIVTDPDNVIAYRFEYLNLNKHCEDEVIGTCDCNNSLTVSSAKNGDAAYKQYCSGEKIDTIHYSESIGSTLVFNVKMLPDASVSLQIRMFTLRYLQNKTCANDELLCSKACVQRSLACGPDRHEYCNSPNEVCSSVKISSHNSGLIGGVVGGLIAFLVIAVILTLCLRGENSILRKTCFKQQIQSNSSRANAIFTVHGATQAVSTSGAGNDNQAYTEYDDPLGRVTFQPPPEYSSLEHIDRAGRGNEPKDGGDLPPSYEDAVQNRDQNKL
ncbi:uncharacterized protein LOC127872992 [Dreissena polymorpha]|uniref:CUB domain-containing protein n=1 Tax=Dreissena polymorpha TaxID=45954 RepID=A0A9D4QVI6_DREPO|nr:uncharacterized protein LOC127872992 [Dreissena polymorpha]XP_052272490.1 uncharacterized protein LOC127872992 [Dreissena polymorpha]XP_052272491.1 uncharacterized protein LOC127872992 [Dreissena polymorpha]XP_052272492.1 uncharacterized protein LOC127872992 [Dreissena polymorpha]XP_052272493.1 uncharacterized protein LOC127872992 [Dreissena polymorpha]XP_052272494.1 uncharacterized protein LOC127872992 [Dreissena polymorpha]XP_052272495.1 uncharacterized protein LOC127872992 [Dreissena po